MVSSRRMGLPVLIHPMLSRAEHGVSYALGYKGFLETYFKIRLRDETT